MHQLNSIGYGIKLCVDKSGEGYGGLGANFSIENNIFEQIHVKTIL